MKILLCYMLNVPIFMYCRIMSNLLNVGCIVKSLDPETKPDNVVVLMDTSLEHAELFKNLKRVHKEGKPRFSGKCRAELTLILSLLGCSRDLQGLQNFGVGGRKSNTIDCGSNQIYHHWMDQIDFDE
jgi:hypothetical protein